MPASRDQESLLDIVQAAQQIQRYTASMTRAQFNADDQSESKSR